MRRFVALAAQGREVERQAGELQRAGLLRRRDVGLQLLGVDRRLLRRDLGGLQGFVRDQALGAQLLALRRFVGEDLGVEPLALQTALERCDLRFEVEARLFLVVALRRQAVVEPSELEPRARGVELDQWLAGLHRFAGMLEDAHHARFDRARHRLLERRQHGARGADRRGDGATLDLGEAQRAALDAGAEHAGEQEQSEHDREHGAHADQKAASRAAVLLLLGNFTVHGRSPETPESNLGASAKS